MSNAEIFHVFFCSSSISLMLYWPNLAYLERKKKEPKKRNPARQGLTEENQPKIHLLKPEYKNAVYIKERNRTQTVKGMYVCGDVIRKENLPTQTQ
jgi:hypothetical protein